MNLMQLKYFLSVCEFGTVSAAADYLHIAQPSLSLAIKELETEFGISLFYRTHKGMRPTPEGELLLGMAKNITDQVDATEKIMKDRGRNKHILKLGIPPMIGALILPKLYRDFLSQNPDIQLDIMELGKDELVNLVSAGQLDAAFISHSKLQLAGVDSLHIDTLRILCCAAPENPITQKSALTPKDLENTPLVMYKDGFFQSSQIRNWFSADFATPDVLIQTNQLSTMLKVIASNTAVGFLFEQLAKQEHTLSAVALDPPIQAEVSLIWKKDRYSFSALETLKAYLKSKKLFA